MEHAEKPAGPSSRTRDHLANERTFLARVRTALGLIGLGFVLARMNLFLRQLAESAGPAPAHGRLAGGEFIVSGVVFLVLGTVLSAAAAVLYRRTRRAIEADRYEPAWGAVLAPTAVVVLGGSAIAALVLWRLLAAPGP